MQGVCETSLLWLLLLLPILVKCLYSAGVLKAQVSFQLNIGSLESKCSFVNLGGSVVQVHYQNEDTHHRPVQIPAQALALRNSNNKARVGND